LDKELVGRFQKALRAVGAAGSVAVRPRMITAVAGTKFKTLSGLPVSLVGLHGKDDLLVLGPAWAIERLGSGQVPPVPAAAEHADWLLKCRELVATEIECLTLLPQLLELVPPSLKPVDFENSPKLAAASELLQGLLRATVARVHDYFSTKDVNEFVTRTSQEAKAVLEEIEAQIEQGAESYPLWWVGWESEVHGDAVEVLFTETGRHVTSYPVSGDAPERLRKARNSELRPKLTAFAAA
jgi:hypothetical protein